MSLHATELNVSALVMHVLARAPAFPALVLVQAEVSAKK